MPELDLGRRRAETKGEIPVVKINAADSRDGKDHAWRLPLVMSQADMRRMTRLAQMQDVSQDGPVTPEKMGVVMDAMDEIFKMLFGEQADDAAEHLGPEDFEAIFEYYGLKVGESQASPGA